MHSPPPVRYPVGRSRTADRLLGICWMSGAACAGAAATQPILQGMADWRAWVPCAAALLSGLSLWRSRRQVVTGELTFDDGEDWSLASADGAVVATGDARIHLDLQRLMLLRVETTDRHGHWLWVDRDADRPRWRDLRRALYAGARGVAHTASRQGERFASA